MNSKDLFYLYLASLGITFISSYLIDGNKILGYKKAVGFEKVQLPIKIENDNNDYDLNRFNKNKEYDYVKTFCETIEKNVDKRNLNIFYNNIKSLSFKNFNFKLLNFVKNSKIKGFYHSSNNIYLDDIIEGTIFHELTHMASSTEIDGIYYSGFMQQENKFKFGYGLNEGYTELETQRNFSDYKKNISYNILVHYSELLELVVGKDSMQKYYYNANLYGLLDELKSYAYIDEIMNFIKNLDYIKQAFYETKSYKKITKMYSNVLIRTIREINDFLLKIYIIKINRLETDGNLNENETKKYLQEFIIKLVYGVDIDNNHYEIYDEDLDSCFDNTFMDAFDQLRYEKVLKKSSN